MREAISNTAELGAVMGGKRIVDDGVRSRMREILGEIREGRFAAALRDEEASGYPLLREAREQARAQAVEKARRKLED
jgi:ketol-acid reductoisomerase